MYERKLYENRVLNDIDVAHLTERLRFAKSQRYMNWFFSLLMIALVFNQCYEAYTLWDRAWYFSVIIWAVCIGCIYVGFMHFKLSENQTEKIKMYQGFLDNNPRELTCKTQK
ncbi:hypothetical protein [Vibrio panuliri]|nr:hypothetical protein [Vibrio panuliri]KAB1460871.1 hypothetical protein F7O85_00405 [Vibrio panuliri]